METVQSLLAWAGDTLKEAGIESWKADARVLTQEALQLTKEDLILKNKEITNIDKQKHLKGMIARRVLHEPVSRIIGTRDFWKFKFNISTETLDPRADSETLVEACLQLIPVPLSILDLGTGSGCLLLSLLHEWPQAQGVGVDISVDAIATATQNATLFGLYDRCRFTVADWKNFKPDHKFDLVISNPPYIATSELDNLEPEVLRFDPRRALDGGIDGLDGYRSIIKLLPDFLYQKGYVVFEVGYRQAGAVKDLLEQAGFSVLQIATDLAGCERCIVASRGF